MSLDAPYLALRVFDLPLEGKQLIIRGLKPFSAVKGVGKTDCHADCDDYDRGYGCQIALLL